MTISSFAPMMLPTMAHSPSDTTMSGFNCPDYCTISLPCIMFMPQVNSYSPGLSGMNSTGTV